MVLMLKPRVGLIVEVSSPFIRLTMVVLPALSRPLSLQHVAEALGGRRRGQQGETGRTGAKVHTAQ